MYWSAFVLNVSRCEWSPVVESTLSSLLCYNPEWRLFVAEAILILPGSIIRVHAHRCLQRPTRTATVIWWVLTSTLCIHTTYSSGCPHYSASLSAPVSDLPLCTLDCFYLRLFCLFFYLFSFVFNNLKSPKVSKAYVFSPDGSSSGHHRRQRHGSHPHLAFVHLPLTSVLQPCSYVVHFATTDWLSGWTRHPSGPMSCNLPVALCLIWQVQTECLCGVFNAASQPF